MKDALRDRSVWLITILIALFGVFYYGNELNIPAWIPLGKDFFSDDYVHDVHRALFLIPMIYTALFFRLRGAVVVSVVVLAIVVPRGIFISPNPDPLLRSVSFVAVAGFATVLLGLERERGIALAGEIEARREIEAKIDHLNAVLRAIRNVNHLIVATDEVDPLLQGACSDLVETRGYHYAWIAMTNSAGGVDRASGAGHLESFSALMDRLAQGELPACGKQALSQAEIVLTPDASACTDCVLRSEKSGWGAMTIRLEHGGKVLGVLSVSIPAYLLAEDEEQSLFREVASDVAFALHGIELKEDHRKASEALKESEGRYRAIFDNSSNAIYLRDAEGHIIVANRAMSQLTGFAMDELTGMNISEIFHSHNLQIVLERQRRLLDNDDMTTSDKYEAALIRKDGSQRIVEMLTSQLAFDGNPQVFQAMLRDVTEQRRIQDNMRAYTRQITKAQEEERKRISRELHDDTAQALASLGLDIDFMLRANGALGETAVEQLEALRQKVIDVAAGVRRFSQDLRPPMLDEMGLIDTLQWLVGDLSQNRGIASSLEVEGAPYRLSLETELLMFRIAQEALNNVRKHAEASEVSVKLIFMDDAIQLSVTDNGCGFDMPEAIGNLAQTGQLGLVGMRERARLLGGYLKIKSSKGEGTTISLDLKLKGGDHPSDTDWV